MQLQGGSNIIVVPTSVMISHQEVSHDRLTDNLKACLRFNSIATKTKQVPDTLGVLSHWGWFCQTCKPRVCNKYRRIRLGCIRKMI